MAHERGVLVSTAQSLAYVFRADAGSAPRAVLAERRDHVQVGEGHVRDPSAAITSPSFSAPMANSAPAGSVAARTLSNASTAGKSQAISASPMLSISCPAVGVVITASSSHSQVTRQVR